MTIKDTIKEQWHLSTFKVLEFSEDIIVGVPQDFPLENTNFLGRYEMFSHPEYTDNATVPLFYYKDLATYPVHGDLWKYENFMKVVLQLVAQEAAEIAIGLGYRVFGVIDMFSDGAEDFVYDISAIFPEGET